MSGHDLTSTWAEITSHPTDESEDWRFQQIDAIDDGRRLVLAIDDEGQHHLLVPKSNERIPTSARSPLTLTARDFRFGRDNAREIAGRYLDIHCRLPALNGQFDRVIADVVASVRGSADPAAAAFAAVSAWRRLFAILAEGHSLSYPEKLAVFGELTVLQELMELDPTFKSDSWTGPAQAPHDFELHAKSIEVKSVGEASSTITIHGLEQLDSMNGKSLYLVIRTVVENASGRTIAEVLNEILSTIDNPNDVRQAAARLGVSDTDEDPTRFVIRSTMAAEVTDGFPRLVSATVPPQVEEAIGRVSYDLRLKSLSPFLQPTTISHLVARS